uniref:Uncharacterized protein n=1 Tax=Anguilla anguilla TaxID=7936 RepID=A0A0E9UV73_ANGAN
MNVFHRINPAYKLLKGLLRLLQCVASTYPLHSLLLNLTVKDMLIE